MRKLATLSLSLKNLNSWCDYFLRNLNSSGIWGLWGKSLYDFLQNQWSWMLIQSRSCSDIITIFITLWQLQGCFHYLTPCFIVFSRLYILYFIYLTSGTIYLLSVDHPFIQIWSPQRATSPNICTNVYSLPV